MLILYLFNKINVLLVSSDAMMSTALSVSIARKVISLLGSGEINHFGPGENRQFWSNENHQSGVASPQVVLFTRPAAGQPVSQ